MNLSIKRYSAAEVPEAGRPGFWVHAGDFNQALELAANREAALQQRLNAADQRVDDLQSGLTKARDMVRWFYTHANVHQVGTAMMDAAREFLAVPADDVRAVAEEPVAWIKPNVSETLRKDECCYAFGSNSPKGNLIPLYRHPQRPVVLPERIQWFDDNSEQRKAEIDGYNACLDDIARLNK
jgi:hypothetical protein